MKLEDWLEVSGSERFCSLHQEVNHHIDNRKQNAEVDEPNQPVAVETSCNLFFPLHIESFCEKMCAWPMLIGGNRIIFRQQKETVVFPV